MTCYLIGQLKGAHTLYCQHKAISYWGKAAKYILMLSIVSIFMIIIINLLRTVTYMLSVKLPPAFCALQVYLPSSLSVTFARIKFVFSSLSRRFSSLNQDISGLGEPSRILQVRLALSPSFMSLFGLNNKIFGRTTKKYNKTIKQH